VIFERYPVVSVVLGLVAGGAACGLALPAAGALALAGFCAVGGLSGLAVGLGLASLLGGMDRPTPGVIPTPVATVRLALNPSEGPAPPVAEPTGGRFVRCLRAERDGDRRGPPGAGSPVP
jgi:hypothetical protein